MQDPFHAIDINIPADEFVKSTGTAYYRLDDGLYNFILECMEEHDILGFAWEGTRNFGIILKDKNTKNNSHGIQKNSL